MATNLFACAQVRHRVGFRWDHVIAAHQAGKTVYQTQAGEMVPFAQGRITTACV